jgi:hypothetical protein
MWDSVPLEFNDFDHDGPEVARRSKPRKSSILALVAMLLVSGLYLRTTLAANINLNSASAVEFGQGVQMAASCTGGNLLTVTPKAQFVNASGAGSYYFNSVTVSGVPVGCNGVDFNISVFDSTTSVPLSIFNSTSNVAVVYDNAGTFQTGAGAVGLTVSSGSGTFTVTFITPVALATTVAEITIQSSSHAPYSCVTDGVCNVGDIGPGGGIVYFYSSAGFAVPGNADCNPCHYLEVAQSTWKTGSPALDNQSWPLSFNYATAPAQDTATVSSSQLGSYQGNIEKNNWLIGSGFANTVALAALSTNTTLNSYANYVRAYTGSDSSAGKWFVPSFNELNELCKYANGQTTGVTSVQCISGSTFATKSGLTDGLGGFNSSANYWSSSINYSPGRTQSAVMYFGNGQTNFGHRVEEYMALRPVRAFGS